MKNSWNLFWKDYETLYWDSIRFCRKHWFGCLLYAIVMIVYMVACVTDVFDGIYDWIHYMVQNLKDAVRSIFTKGEHEKK